MRLIFGIAYNRLKLSDYSYLSEKLELESGSRLLLAVLGCLSSTHKTTGLIGFFPFLIEVT